MQSVLIVTLDIQPEDVTLSIDGKKVRLENSTTDLVKGKHELLIQSYGYFAAHEFIKVSRKKTYFHIELQKDPNISVISTKDIVIAQDTGSSVLQDSAVLLYTTTNDEDDNNVSYEFKIEMVNISGGVFMMGQKGRDNSSILHEVKIHDFAMGKYEVTQAQWKAIMNYNPSKFVGDSLPVENVSWDEVQIFIKKLNSQTNGNYRLPTEAEWEYAARQGRNDGAASFSNVDLAEDAWYWKNSGDTLLAGHWDNEKIQDNHCRTHKVGLRKPNKLGLYDIYGNVWEWCHDWYSSDYYKDSVFDDPHGPKDGVARVFRGGGWLSKISNCRSGYRFFGKPSVGYSYLGFRLVSDK